MAELLKLPEFSWEEIQKHKDEQSCWCVLHGLVYDVTKFLKQHPGSSHVLLHVGGQDATEAFEDVAHSTKARVLADDFLVGRVKGATDIRKCQEGITARHVSSARAAKAGTGPNLIVAVVLVVIIAIWAFFHFQEDDNKMYQQVPTTQNHSVEYSTF